MLLPRLSSSIFWLFLHEFWHAIFCRHVCCLNLVCIWIWIRQWLETKASGLMTHTLRLRNPKSFLRMMSFTLLKTEIEISGEGMNKSGNLDVVIGFSIGETLIHRILYTRGDPHCPSATIFGAWVIEGRPTPFPFAYRTNFFSSFMFFFAKQLPTSGSLPEQASWIHPDKFMSPNFLKSILWKRKQPRGGEYPLNLWSQCTQQTIK